MEPIMQQIVKSRKYGDGHDKRRNIIWQIKYKAGIAANGIAPELIKRKDRQMLRNIE